MPNISDVTIEAAQANVLAAVKTQVSQFNAQLKDGYLLAFSNWSQNVLAGRSDNSNPPKPPNGYVVDFFKDDTTGPGTDGAYPNLTVVWAYPKVGTSPVCDMPPIPEAPKLYVPPVLPEPDDLRNVPVGDTMPVGYIAVDPQTGKRWQKQVSHTPFGLAYLYRALAVLVCLIAFGATADAQITIACAPQPGAATASLGKVAVGVWACWPTNDGPAPVILTPGKLYQAIITAGKISPVTPAVAQQILNDSVGRLPQSKLVKVGQVGLALGGIAASLYTGNAQWSLIGGLVSQNAPRMISVIQNEIPSTAPFVGGQLSGPVTIVPGADVPPITVFAMKVPVKSLVPFVVKL